MDKESEVEAVSIKQYLFEDEGQRKRKILR